MKMDPRPMWRTLAEQADDPAFAEFLHNEFPSQIEAIADPDRLGQLELAVLDG